MIDNFLKYVLLTPDVIFDVTIGEMDSKELFNVFDEYKKLSSISADNLLNNGGRISFLEVSNSFFDFLISKKIVSEGYIKLASHMHTYNDDRKIILCIPHNEFLERLDEFKSVLTEQRNTLITQVNIVSDELKVLSKLDINTDKQESDKND